MRKFLTIETIDDLCSKHHTYLNSGEFPYACVDHEVSHTEFQTALRILITYLTQNRADVIITDLDKFDESLAPAKKMTISEIEEALGHKIEIVNSK